METTGTFIIIQYFTAIYKAFPINISSLQDYAVWNISKTITITIESVELCALIILQNLGIHGFVLEMEPFSVNGYMKCIVYEIKVIFTGALTIELFPMLYTQFERLWLKIKSFITVIDKCSRRVRKI